MGTVGSISLIGSQSSNVTSFPVVIDVTGNPSGVDGTIHGTVSQVGPVQSGSSGYSYPVSVALPATSSSDMHPGSTANLTITTGEVSNVVAVPTWPSSRSVRRPT